MKKILVYLLLSGLLVAGGLTGCSQGQKTGDNNPAKPDTGLILKDVGLLAEGISLTNHYQDLVLSPSGKLAAFSGYKYVNHNPESKIVLADLVNGSARSYNEAERVLGWLPDDSKVLYHYRGKLRLMDVNTGNYQQIAEDSWYGSISPDGRQIAYAQRGKGLFIYNIETKQNKQLTVNKHDWYPVWYPDGKSLFYFNDKGIKLGDGAGMMEGMARISVESGQMESITSEQGKFRQASWIVPGKSLKIVKGWDDAFHLGILDLEKSKYIDLGEFSHQPSFNASVDQANGQLIVSSKGKVEIYNSQGVKKASYALPEAGLEYHIISASHKGDKISFVQGDLYRNADSATKGNKVKVADTNMQNIKELTGEDKYNGFIVWSQAGDMVISLQMDMENITAVKVLPVDKP